MEKPFCMNCMHMLTDEVHIPYEEAIMPTCKLVAPDSEEARAHLTRQAELKHERELIF